MSNKETEFKDKFIDLQKNGRLFPSWIMMNFKKYKLPAILQKKEKDPCNVKKTKLELRKYQLFLASYLDYRSPYRNILIYHGLGSGKTASAINIYNMLFNYSPRWNVFILIPARLKKNPWMTDLDTWVQSKNKKDRMKNILFVHYDSPYADRDFLDAVKQSDSSKNNLYIFDEAHNFIQNVFNNMLSKAGRRAITIYDYIVNDIKEGENSRVILLSGTPAVNDPFELSIIFNLLRPGIFPLSYTKFNELYISSNKLLPERKNMFQRRILGLVSYYLGATPDLYAKKIFHQVDLVMDKYHLEVYNYYEDIERKLEQKAAISRTQSNVYRSYTRQASNFVFPTLSGKISGENRPRPGQFRLTEQEIGKLEEGVELEKDKKLVKKQASMSALKEYQLLIKKFLLGITDYFKKLLQKDKTKKYKLETDVKVFLNEYKGDFNKFWREYNNKSFTLRSLYASSCKMTAIIFNIFKSKGPVVVYSNYVKMEGLEIFKIYLEVFGFTEYGSVKGNDNFRFVEYTGAISKDKRESGRKYFNDKKNIFGKLIKIILISPAGSEGISLLNVRQVHIMEPYWNEVRIVQLIGRAIRACSHKNLPINERKVDIYRYKAIRQKGKLTTDQLMEEHALNKLDLVESFLKTMREVAVDCQLFKNHNNLLEEIKCFQFNKNDIIAPFVGPAYIEDIDQDSKIDSGLNSEFSIKKTKKVYKVKCVKKLKKDKYSNPIYYWYSPEDRLLFDIDFNFPVATIKLDNYNIPEMYQSYYIIGKLVNIPQLSIYN
jgi:superfamily II DNA or RNA helicase